MQSSKVVFLKTSSESTAISLKDVLSHPYRCEARLANIIEEFAGAMAREMSIRARHLEAI